MIQSPKLQRYSVSLGNRITKVLALEAGVFSDIASDPRSMRQALAIVLIGAVAAAVGTLDDSGLATFIPTVLVTLFGWAVWSWLIYVAGMRFPDKIYKQNTTPEMRSVFKVIGFAQAPALLRAAGVISSLGPMIAILSLIWIIVAMSVGTNQLFGARSLTRSAMLVLITLPPYLVIVGGFTLLTTG